MPIDVRRYDRKGRLRDGSPLRLRAVRPDDRAQLLRFFNRLGARSSYFRFMVPRKRLTDKELAYLCEPDFDRHIALVALLPIAGEECVVGLGRYVIVNREEGAAGQVAEVAFVVSDAHQGRGVGTLLLEHLAAIARSRGVSEFVADVLAENRRMMEVFLQSGFKVRRAVEAGVYHVSIPIDATEAFMRAHAQREGEARGHQASQSPGPEQ